MSSQNASQPQLKKEMGLIAAIAMCMGTAIGSGIFTAPQNLAAVTDPVTGFTGWVIAALGAAIIVLSFANLATRLPFTGGAVVYAQQSFGDFWGFLVAWMYWITNWTSVAAIITACVRYVSNIFPMFAESGAAAFALSTAILWFLTWLNIRGIKEGATVQIVTTALKIIPLVVFIVLAIPHFDASLLKTVSPGVKEAGGGGWPTLAAAVAITFWAFTGIESSTVTGGEIRDPEKNLPRSVFISTILVAALYLSISYLASGIMSQEQLANSNAPFSEMINLLAGGTWGGLFISVGVVISTLGSSNGCLIVASRVAYGAAEEGMFPDFFRKVNAKTATPVASLIFSSILINILLVTNYVQSLNAAFTFVMLLATMTILIPYAAAPVAEIVLLKKGGASISFGAFIMKSLLPLLTFAYVIYAIYGCGPDAVMWGFLLMLAGMPVYAYVALKKRAATEETA